MLNRNTTFVLGAGASVELGFPLGAELQTRISSRAREEAAGLAQANLEHLDRKTYAISWSMNFLNHEEPAIERAQAKIAHGLPLAQSIDAFLFNNRHNQAIVDCGKLHILQAIISAERNSPLYGEEEAKAFCQSNAVDNRHGIPWRAAALNSSFMGALWKEVSASHTIENLDLIFKNITIVNFNYDRSFEAAILFLLHSTFEISEDDALRIVDRIPIIRPYGCPHGDSKYSEASTKYGSLFGVHAHKTLENFRTFTESVDEGVSLQAKDAIAKSSVLVYLGFAFHPQNVDLLQVDGCADKHVFFSHFNDSKENCDDLCRELSVRMGPCWNHGTRIPTQQIHGCIATSRQTLLMRAQSIFRS